MLFGCMDQWTFGIFANANHSPTTNIWPVIYFFIILCSAGIFMFVVSICNDNKNISIWKWQNATKIAPDDHYTIPKSQHSGTPIELPPNSMAAQTTIIAIKMMFSARFPWKSLVTLTDNVIIENGLFYMLISTLARNDSPQNNIMEISTGLFISCSPSHFSSFQYFACGFATSLLIEREKANRNIICIQ